MDMQRHNMMEENAVSPISEVVPPPPLPLLRRNPDW